eukprot:m.102901 g.102901  ORF g.102901 m.102901 type:complete len:64 (-) comp13228_c0_seq8:830-1021(-)
MKGLPISLSDHGRHQTSSSSLDPLPACCVTCSVDGRATCLRTILDEPNAVEPKARRDIGGDCP